MKIVITDCDHGYFTPEEMVIEQANYELEIAQCRNSKDVYSVARDAEAIICQYVQITSELLQRLPKCRILARYGVGIDNIDLSAATRCGIQVVYNKSISVMLS